MPFAFDLRLALVLALLLAACDGRAPEEAGIGKAATPGSIYEEVGAASGLDFVHVNGASGEFYFPEIMGAGGALLDFDNDGDLDLYAVQGQWIGDGEPQDAAADSADAARPRDRLFRNDSALPAGALRFVDVTSRSQIDARGYGMGVAVGDYDDDGDLDLYVTNWGSNQLWRNNGGGTFSEVTRTAGADDPRWTTSAAFLDFDWDGHLDLYLANYVDYSLANDKACRSLTGRRDYCGPLSYQPEPDRLLRGRGDGAFEDVSALSGILAERGNGLGVVVADFDGDGWTDIYVGNDQMPNFLWINQRNGTFRNEALLAGCAVNMEGDPEASMGIDTGDLDNDGDPDLFMTHLAGETNTLYLNDGRGLFQDQSTGSRLGAPSLGSTGFGTAMLDYDNDGWLDILAVNGAVYTIEELARQGDPFPFHQPNQLFRNLGGGSFADVSTEAGPALARSEVSRGAAFGDVDNDGDTDVAVFNDGGPLRLLQNQAGQGKAWVGVRAVARSGSAELAGAQVVLLGPDGTRRWRRARRDGSYCSANDARVLVGLDELEPPSRLRVVWPDGTTREWHRPPGRRYLTVVGRE